MRVRPTGVERSFGVDEVIVTKTDPQGRITYANDVFLRVSALAEADALGQPHNLIRHPDMPAAVFKLLWDTIKSGQEIFAYVLNLAADGAHYWVFAHVTPSLDDAGRCVGYHSNRRLPDRTAVGELSALYERLRAEERRHPHTPDALAAATALLESELASRGLTYPEFVWDVTNRTMS
ncbi:PAS domain-containing protein [Catenuloplanes indicus]|uniref:PAS domain S-box-containing protein n=1 Tax=Catenuloplanes indicus TaxID=137267 RepID=A0AAE3VXT2_9ACTN|nr:PAS domain-containing protein [Catenuloplanes indicus]MDQ0365562.1 PAS domain S-box-containing protein [Catenuloplanes indicus]